MFGLSIIQERLAFVGVIILVVIGFAWHERYVGAQGCLKNVEKANAVEQAKEVKQHTVDVTTATSEGETFAKTTAAPLAKPAPTIRLCPPLRGKALLPSSAARPEANAEVPSGGENPQQPTFWDTTPIVKAGRDADAQIAGLQDYITNVCRPK